MSDKTGKQAPESLDVAQAVALMDDAASQPETEAEQEAEATGSVEVANEQAANEQAANEEATNEEATNEEAAEEGAAAEETPAAADDAPEFWSAEDKAAWNDVPAELRPVLKKYEQQRVEFVNEKAREAAAVRAQAAEDVKRANATLDQAATWWRQAGPALQRAVTGKWSQVDWKALAGKDPAEYARLDQQRREEQAVLAEAERRGQEEITAAQARAEQEFQRAREAENARLAARLPDWFGTPETARKTWDALRTFLFAKGIAADRINAVYEAPIVELALSAMRFEQARKKASTATAANAIAKPTPTRVASGPAAAPKERAGNRKDEASRQVGERFRKSGGTSIADAAELIRINGL